MQQLAFHPAAVTLQYVLIDSATGQRIDGDHGATHAEAELGPDIGSFSLKWTPLPQAATYLIIVTEFRHGATQYAGRYRIRLVGADTRPESALPVMQNGDSIHESIDRPGDVDEFKIVAVSSTKDDYIFGLRAETGNPADTLLVETGGVVGLPIVGSIGTDVDMRVTERGEYRLQTDTIRVRIRALRGATTGPYTFTVYRVNYAPERAARDVVVGDTISESLGYARDVDEFRFIGNPLWEYAVALQSTSGSVSDTVELTVPEISISPLLGVSTRLALLGNTTESIRGATYTIRIVGLNDHVKRGEYRLVVLEINRKPEKAPEVMVVGDTISETLTFRNDVDEFNVQVTAGDFFVIYAQVLDADTAALAFDAYELPGVTFPTPTTGIRFFAYGGTPNLRATRSRLLGANETGIMRVRVNGGTYRGSYRFAIGRLQRAPESASSLVPIDVIVRESLDPPGDIDDYSFNCVEGQQLAGSVTSVLKWFGFYRRSQDFLPCFLPPRMLSTSNYPLRVEGGGWMENPYRLRIRPIP